MACSSADWVLGLARLISSAISSWAKIGPLTKRKLRRPLPELSSSTSEPMMSEGIRSGVNWMRLASSPSTLPSVSTSSVLARPGTPISSACPPDKDGDERALDHLLLAEDHRRGGFLDALDALAGRLDAADDGVVSLCECVS